MFNNVSCLLELKALKISPATSHIAYYDPDLPRTQF